MASTDMPVLLRPAPVLRGGSVAPLSTILLSPQLVGLTFVAFIASTLLTQAADDLSRPSVLSVLMKWLPLVFSGFLFNLLVGVLSMLVGTVTGVLLGLALMSLLAPARAISWVLMQFFRNAPWLVLLFYAMFLLPFEINLGPLHIAIPAWIKAVLGLALPVMANVAEIVRGGVQSIPLGQWESAESLAFSRRQILWQIILPQALKRMIPPWMNLYAILTMATTLISIVGIQDGMTIARAALVAEGRLDLYLPMYLMLLLLFFAYCYPIALWTAALERRYAVKD
jgi:polar amino acid transport system permease protein